MAACGRNVLSAVSLGCAFITRRHSFLQVPKLWNVVGVRGRKRWERPVMQDLYRRRLEQGPEPERHRSKWINWNYNAEMYAFGKRLGESFKDDTLRVAFTHRSYIKAEESRRAELGLGDDQGSMTLEDNEELAAKGEYISSEYIKAYVRHCLPKLPDEGVSAIHNHLMTDSMLAYIARNLGFSDIILCEDFPPEEGTLSKTFKAVVGALVEDQGVERAQLFVQDFVLTQLVGKTVADIWKIDNPMGLLVQLLTQAGHSEPESRLIWDTGSETMVAAYMVGIYVNQQLLGKAPGETVTIAEEMAALDALWRVFETSDNCKPFKFGKEGHRLNIDVASVISRSNNYPFFQLQ